MSYPVTHVTLTAEDASSLRDLHVSGEDTAVLARVRELAASAGEQLSTGQAWEAIDLCLRGRHLIGGGESVFGRRDRDIRLLDSDAVAVGAAVLSEVSEAWLRERFTQRVLAPSPGPVQPDPGPDFDEVWENFTRLAGFFTRADRARHQLLRFGISRFWRPPRVETGPDGLPRVVRPRYRPQDYTVDLSSTRALPANGGSWPFEADLTERDGALYSWTEVDRFIRGGRTWVRLTKAAGTEYYIDVEIADDRIGRIEAVDPLIAYWIARRTDKYPVVLEED